MSPKSTFTKTNIILSLVLLVIAGIIAPIIFVQSSHANALWNIVQQCEVNLSAHKPPTPCVSIEMTPGRSGGVAVLKDKVGNTQYLVLPTAKITGIESPVLWSTGATNYFARAWDTTVLIDQRVDYTLPPTDFALAVNSISGRTQNQLHIHVDCIQPAVKAALMAEAPEVKTEWHALSVTLHGHQYRAIWLPGTVLGQRNPFQILASSLPDPVGEMASHTLVLVGGERNGEPGFILLDGKANPVAVLIAPLIKLGSGSGEELEDHNCQISQEDQ